jgi:hypothetical protein
MNSLKNRLTAIDNIDFWNVEVDKTGEGFTKSKEAGGQWGVYPVDNAPTLERALKALGLEGIEEIEPVLDEMILTTADHVSRLFDDDGSRFEVDGLTVDEACQAAGGELEVEEGMWRYEFSDGSAITGGVEGWDIESDKEYFLMRG